MPELKHTLRNGRKKANESRLASLTEGEPDPLAGLFAGLESEQAEVRFGSLKQLRLISEKEPEVLYPHFEFFVRLLDSVNHIFQWNAIIIIGNLARVDSQNRIESIFAKFFAPIGGPVMITAANVIGAAATIAAAKPELADKIAYEILKVEAATYKTAECRNIACGHAVKSFRQFFPLVKDKSPVIEFVQRQLANTRHATKAKAQQFLVKFRIG